MPGKKTKKPVSQAQARLFGAIAGGAKTGASGMSAAKAKEKLKGTKVSKLPAYAKKKKR